MATNQNQTGLRSEEIRGYECSMCKLVHSHYQAASDCCGGIVGEVTVTVEAEPREPRGFEDRTYGIQYMHAAGYAE